MAWIESHQTLDKNGKLLELALRLSINRYQAIGHLHALWWWAIDNAEDGNLKRFSNDAVTQACGWSDYIKDEIDRSRIDGMTNRGNRDGFIPALIECGFLDQKDDGLWIHNWNEYTHRYFKSVHRSQRTKELTKKRVKEFRKRNANVTQEKRDVTPPTIPNHTVPNHTEPKLQTPTSTTQPKKRPSGPVGPADPEVAKLTDLFLELLKAKSGDGVSFPVVRARKFLKTMLKTNTSLHLATTIRNYFDSTDTFIKNSGYSWGSFDIKFNALKGGPIHAGTNQARGNWKNNRIPNQSVVEDGSIYDAKIQR